MFISGVSSTTESGWILSSHLYSNRCHKDPLNDPETMSEPSVGNGQYRNNDYPKDTKRADVVANSDQLMNRVNEIENMSTSASINDLKWEQKFSSMNIIFEDRQNKLEMKIKKLEDRMVNTRSRESIDDSSKEHVYKA